MGENNEASQCEYPVDRSTMVQESRRAECSKFGQLDTAFKFNHLNLSWKRPLVQQSYHVLWSGSCCNPRAWTSNFEVVGSSSQGGAQLSTPYPMKTLLKQTAVCSSYSSSSFSSPRPLHQQLPPSPPPHHPRPSSSSPTSSSPPRPPHHPW